MNTRWTPKGGDFPAGMTETRPVGSCAACGEAATATYHMTTVPGGRIRFCAEHARMVKEWAGRVEFDATQLR